MTSIKFLIDECLHVSLPGLAHARQYPATHVVHQGLAGTEDEKLLERILAEGEVLCTNNASDFTGVLGTTPIHPGLVVFEVNTFADLQQRLLSALLDYLEEDEGEQREDLINRFVYLDLDSATKTLHEPAYERPLTEEERQAILAQLVPQIREEERPPL